MIDDCLARAIELRRQPPLGHRHADAVRETLAEGAGRCFDPRRQPELGMSGSPRSPLPELHQVLEREPVSGQKQQGVEEHAGVPRRQHEAVAVRPVGVRRSVPEEPGPDYEGGRGGAHRGAGMAGYSLLDRVDRERPDGVDGEPFQAFGSDRHGPPTQAV